MPRFSPAMRRERPQLPFDLAQDQWVQLIDGTFIIFPVKKYPLMLFSAYFMREE